MNKKIALFLIMLISAAAIAKDLPRIAVYVTGDVPDNERRALGTRMLASLINSGRYRGIERSNAFLAEIEREQVKQRSGAIDDGQISELGRQFGVGYICIADITPAFGSYQVSARIVDVETAEVVSIGESHSPLKTMDELTQVSNEVVSAMFGEQAGQRAARVEQTDDQLARQAVTSTAQPSGLPMKPTFWAAIGLDVLGTGIITYGIIENGKASNHINRREYSKAEGSMRARNVAYTIGTAVLLGGISVHIFF